VFELAEELGGYLGSADPELRDDLAYTILDVWIVHKPQFTNEQLVLLADRWQNNLRSGIGETGSDSIFKRSFSALCLAAIAEHELKAPFLDEVQFRTLVKNSLAYLNDEQDLRGFDPVKGWIHATAHTADLLGALAENQRFTVEDQHQLLAAVEYRLATAEHIFSYGEQDRLAVAVSAAISRADFDSLAFQTWLTKLDATDQQVWKDSPPNDQRLRTFQNNSYFLEALSARLSFAAKSPLASGVLLQLGEILRRR